MNSDKMKISAKDVANRILSEEPVAAWAWWEWAHEQDIGVYWTIENLTQHRIMQMAMNSVSLPGFYKSLKETLLEHYEGIL